MVPMIETVADAAAAALAHTPWRLDGVDTTGRGTSRGKEQLARLPSVSSCGMLGAERVDDLRVRHRPADRGSHELQGEAVHLLAVHGIDGV
jgi:hypothetical protein